MRLASCRVLIFLSFVITCGSCLLVESIAGGKLNSASGQVHFLGKPVLFSEVGKCSLRFYVYVMILSIFSVSAYMLIYNGSVIFLEHFKEITQNRWKSFKVRQSTFRSVTADIFPSFDVCYVSVACGHGSYRLCCSCIGQVKQCK